jgi:hypothetical protein
MRILFTRPLTPYDVKKVHRKYKRTTATTYIADYRHYHRHGPSTAPRESAVRRINAVLGLTDY